MFTAIRSLFGKLASRVRAGEVQLHDRGIAWLFTFEFAVVLLGVLAAQKLQDWAREREIAKEVEASHAYYVDDIRDLLIGSQMWQAAVPCMRTRVEAVMTLAAEGKAIPSGMTDMPELVEAWVSPVTQEMLARFKAIPGNEHSAQHSQIVKFGSDVTRDTAIARNLWRQLVRADTRLGPANAADRDALRETGAALLAVLSNIEESSAYVVGVGKEIGLEPSDMHFRGTDHRPARTCEEIWQAGSMLIADTDPS